MGHSLAHSSRNFLLFTATALGVPKPDVNALFRRNLIIDLKDSGQ